jgi:hypothetical protein
MTTKYSAPIVDTTIIGRGGSKQTQRFHESDEKLQFIESDQGQDETINRQICMIHFLLCDLSCAVIASSKIVLMFI